MPSTGGVIKRTGSQDNERYQINKVLGDVLDTLERASDWDAAASWGDHREVGYASEEDAILAGVQVPQTITLSYNRDTLPNGTDIARIRATWPRVANPEFVYDLEIREKNIGAAGEGSLYSVPIISNTEGGSIAAYESEFKLDKTYRFRIRIRRNRVISPWSNFFEIDTTRDATAPGGGSSGGGFAFSLSAQARLAAVELSWNRPNTPNLESYELRRTVGGQTTFINLPNSLTRFTDSGLEPNTAHSYRIRARSFEGVFTGLSNTATATPFDYAVPSVPTGLTANSSVRVLDRGAQTAEITFTWNQIATAANPNIRDIAGVTYDVEIARAGVVQSVQNVAGNRAVSTASLTFVGEVGVAYSARVRARNITQVSDWTAPVSRTQAADTSSPGNTTGLSATGFPGVIYLQWTNPVNNIAARVQIQRRIGSNAFATITEVPIDTRDYVDVNVVVGTAYEYRVRAVSAANVTGNFSNTSTATAQEPNFLAPGTAPILSVSSEIRTLLTGTQVALYTVSWPRFVGDQFTYDLQIRDGSAGPVVGDPVLANPADGTTVRHQFTGETNKTYCFRARARNATVTGPWSGQLCQAQGNDATPPGNITGISTLGVYQGALITWNIPGFLGTNYSHVEVWRRFSGFGSGSLVATVSRPMGHYFDGGLVIGTSYEYRLRPVSFAGVLGNFTGWSAVTPLNVPVGSITTTSITAGAVTTPLLATNAVVADKIATNAITSDKINANAVTADKINVNNLSAVSTQTGTLTANLIRTAAPNLQRVELTDPGTDGVYALWIGQGPKSAANAVFYIRHDGNVFIRKPDFDINDGQIITTTASASNTSAAGQGSNTLTATLPAFTANGSAYTVAVDYSYGAAASPMGQCPANPSGVSGTLALQRRVNAGSWVTVDTRTVATNTQTQFFQEPGLSICYIQASISVGRTLADTAMPTSGTVEYRVIFSSWSSFFTSGQTNTNSMNLVATRN